MYSTEETIIIKYAVSRSIKILVTVFFIPIIIIIRILRPVAYIRIGYFTCERIGHFAYDLGIALAEKELLNDKRVFDLRYLQGKPSNMQLVKMAKRSLYINSWVSYLVYANNLLPGRSHDLIPHRRQCASRDKNGALELTKSKLLFSQEEEGEAIATLKRFGVRYPEDKFICLNVRDSEYFNEDKKSKNFARNTDIKTYEEAALYLANHGYWVIRTGKKVKDSLLIKHKRIIDYAVSDDRSDLLDIWLFSKCYFCISTGTGIDAVADIYRRPLLFVNFIPLTHMITWSRSITASKHLIWKDSGVHLTLSEYLKYHYNDKRIDVVDLDPNEIKSVVMEMIGQLDGTLDYSKEDEENQKIFMQIYMRSKSFHKLNNYIHPNSRISANFIRRDDFLT